MSFQTREAVAERAGHRCEYCLLPEDADPYAAFHLEHIVARVHGGDDGMENLAWSCSRCNCRKGTNLASIDSVTGALVELFHPRRQVWGEHFGMREARIFGLTPSGSVTVKLLDMNAHHRVQLRRQVIRRGDFGR